MNEFVLLQSRISNLDFSAGTYCGMQVKIPITIGSS